HGWWQRLGRCPLFLVRAHMVPARHPALGWWCADRVARGTHHSSRRFCAAAEIGEGMSLKTRIIPCLDVAGGRVVKGVQFVDLVDAGDPVEAAMAYDAAGADELTFLDITASHEGRDTIFDVVARTAEHCFMPV